MRSISSTSSAFLVIVIAFLICPTGLIGSDILLQDNVTKLIGDLNDISYKKDKNGNMAEDTETSVKTNNAAREALKKIGVQAAPFLVSEVSKYADFSQANLMSAARCLRVLKEMNNPGAIDIAINILENVKPFPEQMVDQKTRMLSRALLVEALIYLANTGDNKARDAVLRFVGNDPVTAGWLSKSGQLHIDVFVALDILVKKQDAEVGQCLSAILTKLPYQIATYAYKENDEPVEGYYAPHLDQDGYSIVSLYIPKDENKKEPFSPVVNQSPRILCLDWLGKLKCKESISEIEKLLHSEQKAERDAAINAIEVIKAIKELNKNEEGEKGGQKSEKTEE